MIDEIRVQATFPETPFRVLLAGLIYIGSVWFAPEIFRLYQLPYTIDSVYLRANGLGYMLAHASLGFLPLILIAVDIPKRDLTARALTGEKLGMMIQTLVASVCVAFLLDYVGVWHWIWRWRDTAFEFGRLAVEAHAWGVIIIGLLTFGLIFPVIEEIVFRYALLTTLLRLTHSRVLSAVLGSLLFSVLHFGPSFRMGAADLEHALRLFVLGLLLSTLTLARSGRIGLSIAVHAGRNIAEQVALILWVLSSFR